MRALLPLPALLLFAACSDELPAASLIDKLRVLAVQAEPPEVAPGQPTRLRMLAVEPVASAPPTPAPLTAVWLACRLPPGVSNPPPCGLDPGALLDVAGAPQLPPSCADRPTASPCLIGTELEATLTPDPGALGPDGAAQLLVTVVVADTAGGAADCLEQVASRAGLPSDPDHCVIALKRLQLSDPTHLGPDGAPPPLPNSNPALDGFTLAEVAGAAVSLLDGSATFQPSPPTDPPKRTLEVHRSAASAERHPDGRFEALTVAWFSTAGKIEGGRSSFDPPGCAAREDCGVEAPVELASTSWIAPTAEVLDSQAGATGRVRFWAILRDDRGGVSWVEGAALAP